MVELACSFRALTSTALLLALLLVAHPVSAAEVLLVSDASSGTGLAAVLTADGHTVTSVTADYSTGNAALRAPLSSYDVVYWVANGSGGGTSHTNAAVFSNLTSYVMAGGRVFVTGYDSVASPLDAQLIAFLGATSANDTPSAPGAVSMIANSLTTGVVDIRGVTPTGGSGDRDALLGLVGSAVSVVTTASNASQHQWTIRPLGSGEIVYVSNGDSSGTHLSWSNTAAGGAGVYNAALRNFAHAAEAASADPGAPEISFDWPSSVDEGAAFTLEVTIDDLEGDSYTFSWDLDDDGTFGEMPGVTTHTIAADTTDGPESLRFAVQAVDAGGNTARRSRAVRIVNVAPTITSIAPARTGIGGELRYPIEAVDPAGVRDPFTYTLLEGPEGAAITGGVFSWAPDATDVTTGVDTTRIEIEVADGDGGTDSQLWELTVLPNAVPEAGGLVYPIDGIVISEAAPRLVIQNGNDPDLDPLTYYFELDTINTFDSPLFASGPIPEMPGLTEWYPGELAEGVYFWRAWASDGTAQTDPQETTFQVYLSAVGPVDSGLPGDGGVDAMPPAVVEDTGLRCSATGALGSSRSSRWSFGWWLVGLGALGLARRARRSRT